MKVNGIKISLMEKELTKVLILIVNIQVYGQRESCWARLK